jgi:hypothetical protein
MTTSDLDDDEGANALSDNFRLRRLHTSPSSESLCGFDERERERERKRERERETRN